MCDSKIKMPDSVSSPLLGTQRDIFLVGVPARREVSSDGSLRPKRIPSSALEGTRDTTHRPECVSATGDGRDKRVSSSLLQPTVSYPYTCAPFYLPNPCGYHIRYRFPVPRTGTPVLGQHFQEWKLN